MLRNIIPVIAINKDIYFADLHIFLHYKYCIVNIFYLYFHPALYLELDIYITFITLITCSKKFLWNNITLIWNQSCHLMQHLTIIFKLQLITIIVYFTIMFQITICLNLVWFCHIPIAMFSSATILAKAHTNIRHYAATSFVLSHS